MLIWTEPTYYENFNCQFCGGNYGRVEWQAEEKEWWFCCFKCRDTGEPCETFFKEEK